MSGIAMARARQLELLAARTATPFYALDLDAVLRRHRAVVTAWRARFPRFRCAYSFKTNALRAVTEALRRAGSAAEVVSGCELSWALDDGYPGHDIYFDGPVKGAPELRAALDAGANIQVDSLEELELLCGMLRDGSSSSRVALRLSTPRGTRWSRFGLMAKEVPEALRLLDGAGRTPDGVHLHIGSNVGDTGAHAEMLRLHGALIARLARRCRGLFSVDLGGGFAADSARAGEPSPPASAYATSVAAALDDIGLDPANVQVVIEPGRCLVEDDGFLLTRVTSVKRRQRRVILTVDAPGTLVRSTASWHHPIHVFAKGTSKERVEIYGANCFEGDKIGEAIIGAAEPGALVAIGSAGGYDMATAQAWTRPLPPVLVRRAGRWRRARDIESPAALRDNHLSLLPRAGERR